MSVERRERIARAIHRAAHPAQGRMGVPPSASWEDLRLLIDLEAEPQAASAAAMREHYLGLADAVLAEVPERVEARATRSVLEDAAVRALAILEGPDPTPDGDGAAMVARTILRSAMVDVQGVREAIQDGGGL